MPFTCVTLYNPDSQDNNLCDKRILAITNLEIKQINRKKMFCAIQQTSDGLLFLHRSYMRANQNGGLLLRENQARQLSTRLNKPLTAQRRSHRLIEPSNHWTKNLKSLKNMVCCRLMPGSKNRTKKTPASRKMNLELCKFPCVHLTFQLVQKQSATVKAHTCALSGNSRLNTMKICFCLL